MGADTPKERKKGMNMFHGTKVRENLKIAVSTTPCKRTIQCRMWKNV